MATSCPFTREEFNAKAAPVRMTLDGANIDLGIKEFATGSFGWYQGGKVMVKVDGKPVACQLGISVIVLGSKTVD